MAANTPISSTLTAARLTFGMATALAACVAACVAAAWALADGNAFAEAFAALGLGAVLVWCVVVLILCLWCLGVRWC